MQGYDKNYLFVKEIKGESWEDKFLKKTEIFFYDRKKKLIKGIKKFLP